MDRNSDSLSLDQRALIAEILEQLNFNEADTNSFWTNQFSSHSGIEQSVAIGRWLSNRIKLKDDGWRLLASHSSEIVRGWAAILVGLTDELTFAKKLAWIKPFADDDHPALHEMACISLRSNVIREPIAAIDCLVPWTGSRNERLRRFAAEITRPCGVWSSPSQLLQEQPELGLPILEPLSSDPSQYVQIAVGCWLSDASKTKPQWVQSIAARWLAESESLNTQSIIHLAVRTAE